MEKNIERYSTRFHHKSFQYSNERLHICFVGLCLGFSQYVATEPITSENCYYKKVALFDNVLNLLKFIQNFFENAKIKHIQTISITSNSTIVNDFSFLCNTLVT